MLEASKFSALVVSTIQGFSRKNRTPSPFLNFEKSWARPSRLVNLEQLCTNLSVSYIARGDNSFDHPVNTDLNDVTKMKKYSVSFTFYFIIPWHLII